MHALGRHVLVELYDCNDQLLNDPQFIEQEMLKAAELSKATVISSSAHHFNPFGVSGVVVIAEDRKSVV